MVENRQRMDLLDLQLESSPLLGHRLASGQTLGEALDELDRARPDLFSDLLSHQDEWPLGWLSLPEGGDWVADCQAAAQALSAECEELIVCGIGGSALGTQAVYAALDWPLSSFNPLWVLDNVDPSHLAWLVESADLERAALNVISKSGGTLETMAGFVYLLGLLEQHVADEDAVGRRIVATTDARRGLLREWAGARGWRTLAVPDDVGGRFSVLSPVGLLPLAFAGVEVEELLRGAREQQELSLGLRQRDNPAWQLAAIHYLLHTRGAVSETVQYVYGDPLGQLGDWFRQLWAESLGKAQQLDGSPAGQALAPLIARGATDQHSLNQLFMEGPANKLYGFISCREWTVDPQIVLPEDQADGKLGYLRHRGFGELLEASRRGTRDALVEVGRPVYEINFPRLDEASVGAYLQLWMLAAAFSGLLYGVNAFNQPGVERSKVIAKEHLAGK